MMNICEQCGKEFYVKKHKRKQCYDCRPHLRYVNDQTTKICIGGCNRILPNTVEFFKINNSRLSPWCRECTNKDQNERSQSLKLKAIELCGYNYCYICGYDKNIAALSFHHLNTNEKEGRIKGMSLKDLKIELAKCILVCECCHVEIHAGLHPSIFKKIYVDNIHANTQRKCVQKHKKERVEYLGEHCIRCGYDKCIAALNFHHKDPSIKSFGISQKTTMALEDIKSELDKCILLCDNCHEEEHHPLLLPQTMATTSASKVTRPPL